MLPSSMLLIASLQGRLVVGGKYPESVLILDGSTTIRWQCTNSTFHTDSSNNYISGPDIGMYNKGKGEF